MNINGRKSTTSFFQKEDIKKLSKEIIKPVVNIIYDEIYPYVWFLCIYHVFLIFITLANLFLLIRWYSRFSHKHGESNFGMEKDDKIGIYGI
jgi:phosphoribosylamine-glycine ligase